MTDQDMARWGSLASEDDIKATSAELATRGIKTEVVGDRSEALATIKRLIPAGADVMTGASATLTEIGFVDLLKSGNHSWRNLKAAVLAEKDPQRQDDLRLRTVTADYFLGSVHAVARTGEVVVASATGSQLPSYVFSSPHLIWVVGTQKITPDLDDALRRVREYVLPLEDARMKAAGFPGSTIGKLLIFEREIMDRSVTLVFVREKLGF